MSSTTNPALDPRYPIGRAERHDTLTSDQRKALIEQVAEQPRHLAAAVAGLSPAQLDTPYRPGGWTPRQVVHHLADSHMNAFLRCKLTLTEKEPAITVYQQGLWAETADAKTAPVEPSLAIMKNLHERWVILFRSLSPEDWARRMNHPERGLVTLDNSLCIYAWHGRHHTAHITSLREREGWR